MNKPYSAKPTDGSKKSNPPTGDTSVAPPINECPNCNLFRHEALRSENRRLHLIIERDQTRQDLTNVVAYASKIYERVSKHHDGDVYLHGLCYNLNDILQKYGEHYVEPK